MQTMAAVSRPAPRALQADSSTARVVRRLSRSFKSESTRAAACRRRRRGARARGRTRAA
eukprot:SAG31_NODE_2852_length_4995_cov_42.074551_1_plen_58_part_10